MNDGLGKQDTHFLQVTATLTGNGFIKHTYWLGNGQGREAEPVTPKTHFLSLLFAMKKLHFRSCSAPFPHFGSGSMCSF